MTYRVELFARAALDETGSRGFELEYQGATIAGFVVQQQAQIFAYRNSCPHTGAPLDWMEHRFLDLEAAFIQCAVHDARFEIDSGLCVSGPCPGASLQSLAVEQEDGKVYLLLD